MHSTNPVDKVNNAGALSPMPLTDLSIIEGKKLFDLNVWSYIAVTQAFLPQLLKSKGMIVNQTSMASVSNFPFHSVYSASKAAGAAFSDSLRLELAPFGVKVIDLKTGSVASNIWYTEKERLPKDSIYAIAREEVENAMSMADISKDVMAQDKWATAVVGDLLKKDPPGVIWRGKHAFLTWVGTMLPYGFMDGTLKKLTGLDVVERKLRAAELSAN
jgi:1-acylglycerone phosphate reductase